ncbi:MAG: ABC transporter substrate-binding protein [Nitrospiraceae bacterium]|nr:ABC transporter substrate-binding protein [Nitrospiraceae bacterium]
MISKKQSVIHAVSAVVPLLALLLLPCRSVALGQPSPGEVIRTFNDALLEAMKKADELGYSGRYRLLEPVVKKTYALSFMAAQATGRYWKTLTKEEQAKIITAYADWTTSTYAGRFDGYAGEKFEIASENGPRQGTVTVVSRLVTSHGEEVSFHYLLGKVDGSWRVMDIRISGVSQLALTRAQFTAVIRTKGVQGLIGMLDKKIQGFEKGAKE